MKLIEAHVAERSKAADSRSAVATRASSNLAVCILFILHLNYYFVNKTLIPSIIIIIIN